MASASALIKGDIRKIIQHRQLGYILLTALSSLIALHYWVIYGNFRQIFSKSIDGLSFIAQIPIALQEQIGWAAGCILFYFIVPALLIKFVLRHNILDYGWKTRHYWRSFPLYFALYLPVLLAIIVVSRNTEFQQTYPFYMPNTWEQLLIWEVAYVLQFVCVEFFSAASSS